MRELNLEEISCVAGGSSSNAGQIGGAGSMALGALGGAAAGAKLGGKLGLAGGVVGAAVGVGAGALIGAVAYMVL